MRQLVTAVLSLVLLSCTQRAHDAKHHAPDAPALFETAFIDGTKAVEEGQEMAFARKRIGNLKVTSGHIVACDPLVLFEIEPFITVFPKGAFPVELAVARTGNDERVAFARVLFSEQPVVRWEPALTKEQDPGKLKQGEFYGYGVDSGTGGFMDRNAARALQAKFEKDQTFPDKLIAKMDKTYRNTWSWCLCGLDGENAAMFSSGYGDGSYASYVGYDAQGRVARLLTDFYLVSWIEK
jgi:hypothetical protein